MPRQLEDVSQELGLPDACWRRTFRRRLRNWYARAARDLPWRRTRNAYHIWVSEIMLQQTQVATVEPYFKRFIRAFPSVSQLAAAAEQSVLRHWEGLGYYRRARQLHAAAKCIVAEHKGKIPRDATHLRDLPGIGRYTAGAILSIAFDAREPILEANTIRLLARLLALRGEVTTAKAQRILWKFAAEILPRKETGTFNQALMELGSLICTPTAPRCSECPVMDLCRAQAEGLQSKIPAAGRPVRFQQVREAAVVIHRRGRVLLRQCGSGERWEGLWDFPRVPIQADGTPQIADELVGPVRKLTGVTVSAGDHLVTLKHGVTRFRITLYCFTAKVVSMPRSKTAQTAIRWIKPQELAEFPLSSTGRKLAKRVIRER
jgi:A/G-specific adenine glycosylase